MNKQLLHFLRFVPLMFGLFWGTTLTAQTFYETYSEVPGKTGVGVKPQNTGYEVTSLSITEDELNWEILEANADGELLNQAPLSFPSIGNEDAAIRLSDGTYIHGFVTRFGNVGETATFRHIDSDGSLLNEFTYDFPANSSTYSKPIFQELSNGQVYILTGYSEDNPLGPPTGQYLGHLIYDPINDQLIQTNDVLFSSGDYGARFNGIAESSDGNILLNIWTPNVANRHYIVKYELDGTELWRRQVSSLERPINTIVPDGDGGVWYFSSYFNQVNRLDENGEGLGGFDIGAFQNGIMGPALIRGIVAGPNSSCLVLGSASPASGSFTFFTALVTGDGVTANSNFFGLPMPFPTTFNGQSLASGGFAVTGSTRTSGGTFAIPFLLRLDETGNYDIPASFIDLALSADGSVPNPDIYSLHDVTVTIENEGNIAATGVAVSIPLPDGVVHQGGNEFSLTQGTFTLNGGRLWSVGSLAPGATASITLNYFKIADGGLLQYAQVNQANESDIDSDPGNGQAPDVLEDDEVAYGNQGIDFYALNFQSITSAVAQGDVISLPYTFFTRYDGTPYPERVINAFYLSRDQTLSPDDQYLRGQGVDVDQTGNSSQTIDLLFPINTPTGFFYLIGVLDDPNFDEETDEDNNIRVSSVRLLVTEDQQNQPDLVAGFFDVFDDNSYQPGDLILGDSYTLFNTGTPASGDIQLGYYLSADRTLDNTDVQLASDLFQPIEILHNTPQFVSPTLYIPQNTASGDYYLILSVDDDQEVAESYEDNNIRISASKLTVTNGSDPCSPDVTPPLLNCPGDINYTTTDNSVIGTWTVPTVTDECSASPSLTSNFDPGDTFPIGITTVTYTARDAAGNEATCSFNITVTQVTGTTCTNNLLSNPGFEDGFASWLNLGGGSISSNAYEGSSSVSVVASGESRVIQSVAIEGGKTYSLSFRGDNDLTFGEFAGVVFVKFLTATWQPLPLGAGRRVPRNWAESSIEYLAPANAAFAEINISSGAPPSSVAIYVDEVCFSEVGGNGPTPCDLSVTPYNIVCDNNDTNTNPTDDTFTFSLLLDPVGDCGNNWVVDGVAYEFGVPADFGPFLISDGARTLVISDSGDPNQTNTILVSPPADCSDGNSSPLPDLTLSNFSAPSSGERGTVINYTFDLQNVGMIDATGDFVIRTYFSTDDTLSPDDVADGVIPTGNLGAGQTVNNVPGASTIPTSLAAGDYFLLVRVDDDIQISESNENNNIALSTITVTVSGGGDPNCAATSDFPWEDWISNVQIGGDLDQNSGKSPYSDFSNPPFDLTIGTTVDVALTTSYSYFTYDEFWRIWIDLNQDDVFQSNEQVYEGVISRPADGTPSQTLTGSFVLPADATVGTAKVRVIMSRNGYAPPCGNIAFGEVEDYSVNLVANAPNFRGQGREDNKRLTLRPQPVIDHLEIAVSEDLAEMEKIVLVNSLGQVVWARDLRRDTIRAGEWIAVDCSELFNGVYFLQAYGDGRKPMVERVLLQGLY